MAMKLARSTDGPGNTVVTTWSAAAPGTRLGPEAAPPVESYGKVGSEQVILPAGRSAYFPH